MLDTLLSLSEYRRRRRIDTFGLQERSGHVNATLEKARYLHVECAPNSGPSRLRNLIGRAETRLPVATASSKLVGFAMVMDRGGEDVPREEMQYTHICD